MSQQDKFNKQMTCKRRHTPTQGAFVQLSLQWCSLGVLPCLDTGVPGNRTSALSEEISLFGLSSVQPCCQYSKPTLTCITTTCSLSKDLLLSPTPLFTDCLGVVFCFAQLSMAFEVLLSWMRSPFILLGTSSSVHISSIMYWWQCNTVTSNMAQTRPGGRPLDLVIFCFFCFL